MNAMTPTKAAAIVEAVITRGDLADLTDAERAKYYVRVCESIGLNPMTQPFQYIVLNGRLTLYARKDATDQLRTLRGVSIEILGRQVIADVLTVHVRAKDKDGRVDEDFGAVPFPETLKGENRANTILKAITKAKRRVTLSICGLGWLDETEVEDIPATAKAAPAATVAAIPAAGAANAAVEKPVAQPKPEPRAAAAPRRRRPSDPTLVVWENETERAPTFEEGHDHNEQLADDWGRAQGDRLVKAMRQTAPANDGLDIPPSLRRTKPEPTPTLAEMLRAYGHVGAAA